MAPFGSPEVGFGQYITLWAIAAVFVFAVIALYLGSTLGGAIVFFVAGAIIVLLTYAFLKRLYGYLLHGSFRAPRGGGPGGNA